MIDLELSGGVQAELSAMDGERVTLKSPQASAPGSRLEGTALDGRRLHIKVHRCVRTGDAFEIRGRLFDLKRDLRELLLERLSPS
ncbi:MAG: hypothetical protein JRI68_03025 [Deltaproteobacteria bacterium]|nr:hypothetical protein [Deltaproteobacteria bacterium]